MQLKQYISYIGIGSNLDSPEANVDQAIKNLQAHPHISVLAISPYYRTQAVPVGDITEAEAKQQPEYVNAVVKIKTDLTAIALLENMLALEAEQGRTRTYKGVPRIIDLDLLLYENDVIHQTHLMVPHPRMHERAFVLKPLLDIEPKITIPQQGSAAILLANVDQSIVRVIKSTARMNS